MSDVLINAGQKLIYDEYQPAYGGFQDVSLGQTLAFAVEKGEFVQILHTGKGHWVVVSSLRCQKAEVEVYDSLYPALTQSMKHQIAALLCSDVNSITVRYVLVYAYSQILYHDQCNVLYVFTDTDNVKYRLALLTVACLP